MEFQRNLLWVKCPVSFEAKNLHGHTRTLKACLNQVPFPVVGGDTKMTQSNLLCGCGVEVRWDAGRAQRAEIVLVPKDKLAYSIYNSSHVHGQSPLYVSMKNNKAWFSWQGLTRSRQVKFCRPVKSDAESVWPRSWIQLAVLKRLTMKIQMSSFFRRKVRSGLFGPGLWWGNSVRSEERI